MITRCAFVAKLITAATIILLVSPLVAEDHWVVRIDSRDGLLATGFVLDAPGDQAIVITARHVLEMSKVQFRINGNPIDRSAVIGVDTDSDIAALLIPWSGQTGTLAPSPPSIGMSVRTQGTRSGVRSGRVLRIENSRAYCSFVAELGDSGGPVVDDQSRVVAVVTHAYRDESGRHIPPSLGPMVDAIRCCLLKWGWKCQNGRCIRVNPPAIPSQPTQEITPQLPPATWTPIEPLVEDTSNSQAIAAQSAQIERIFERLGEIAAQAESPSTSPTDPRIADNSTNIERLTDWMGVVADAPTVVPDPRIEEYQLRIVALERRIEELEDLPITFSIRGPAGIDSRKVRLGEEIKLFFEGKD